MWFGAGIGRVFVAELFQLCARGKDFDVELIVTDERNHLAVRVQSVFAKHRTRRKVRGLAQLSENEVGGAFLCRHEERLVFARVSDCRDNRRDASKGYERANFDDAFRRYLTPSGPSNHPFIQSSALPVRAGLCESVKQPSAKSANATNGTAGNDDRIQAQFAMLMEKLLAAASKPAAEENENYDIKVAPVIAQYQRELPEGARNRRRRRQPQIV